ncbi:DUF5615 family PIN-like protein [Rhizobium sp. YK2]|uniref:DUF5615 family PIN-like protein n=1 Tax=Rhizobium sp. YK2 TaxID=1860096 RepID=UPI00084CC81E|nr:DUF5615 family PIN-like protein [Rhizobium sp. YK2]OEC94397.1 hypothetical protein A9Z06_33365 [Rhizobium sp. YK2]
MRFLLDENVAKSVCDMLIENGHEAEFVRDLLPAGSADQLVAALAEAQRSILVSHDKDFRSIAPRIPDGQRAKFRSLSMLRLMCPEFAAAGRVKHCLPFIELEFAESAKRHDTRMIVEVKKAMISIYL